MKHSHSPTTPPSFLPPRTPRRSGAERMFTDADGRSWNAVSFPMSAARATGEAGGPGLVVVFTCTSDARLAQRAAGAPAGTRVADLSDNTLRAWLADAPRLGRLT